MTVENNEIVDETVETPEVKTFTQEELDKLLQAEGDKRTTQALATAKAKWEQEFQQKLESERTEAEKLARMSEAERLQAEFDKRVAEFESKQAEFQRAQLESQTIKELSQSGLPIEFANYLLASDAESIKTNIDTFKAQWVSAIEKAVDERLKGSTPQTSNRQAGTMSKLEFGRLDIHTRTKMMQENPEMVNQILAGN